jgi:light-harvesting complex II chlorophyll a/b binding protein 4
LSTLPASPEAVFKLQTAELKHGRLAMIGMLGISAQALKNGLGPLEALQTLGN